ncbi:MAG: DUF975 family protein [Anaerovoracaceae bacterium]
MRPEDLYIVRENPFLIQKKCQIHGRGIFGKFFLGMMIFYMFDTLLPNLLGVVFPKGYMEVLVALNNIPSDVIDLSKVADTPIIVMVYSLIFGGILQTGRALYALTFIRNKKVELSALGEGISVFGKAILLSIVQSIIISFWTMFFIIPGIVAFYNFRQSYYILADNPEKGVMRILAESKTRMLGNRMNLLRLDVSYLSLVLMGYLPVVLFQYLISSNVQIGSLQYVVMNFVISIPLFYAMSIMLMGQTVFYELLIRHGFENFKYVGQDAFRNNVYNSSESANQDSDISTSRVNDIHNDDDIFAESEETVIDIEPDDIITEDNDDSARPSDENRSE